MASAHDYRSQFRADDNVRVEWLAMPDVEKPF
jgi:hypothetical protein